MITHVVFNISVTETRPTVSHCILIMTVRTRAQAQIYFAILNYNLNIRST